MLTRQIDGGIGAIGARRKVHGSVSGFGGDITDTLYMRGLV